MYFNISLGCFMIYVSTVITVRNTRPAAHKYYREFLAAHLLVTPVWVIAAQHTFGEFRYTVPFTPSIQTKQMALLAMRGQTISLAVNNIVLLVFINTGIQYEQICSALLYSSITVYNMSTFALFFWRGMLCFKTPIDIDYLRISVIFLVFLVTYDLIWPFSDWCVLFQHFLLFVHIMSVDLFGMQTKYRLIRGLLNWTWIYGDSHPTKQWEWAMEATVHVAQ